MRKPIVCIFIVCLLLMVLVGCNDTQSNTLKPSALAITMEIPAPLIVPTAAYPSVVSGSVTLVKGTTEMEIPLNISGNLATATVPHPEIGTWTLTAKLYDIDNYVIYAGSETAVIQGEGTTTVNMHLYMTTGDATTLVDISNVPDAASGIVKFSNGGVLYVEQPLTIEETQGNAVFTSLEARVWDIEVEIFNAANELIKSAKNSIQILPGRMNYVSIGFGDSGDLIINVTWELPPDPPTNVTADVTATGIHISWNPNSEPNIVGYRVYRSLISDGAFVRISDLCITTTSFMDTDTYPGHTYWYKVIALNNLGNDSGFSEIISIEYPFVPSTPSEPTTPILANTGAAKAGIDLKNSHRSSYIGPQNTYSLQWKVPIDPVSRSIPSIGPNGNIYVASTTGKLYAFNLDGTEEWVFQAPKPFYASPTVASDGTIYIGATNDNFYAINPDGTVKWAVPICNPTIHSSSATIGNDGTIYVAGYYHIYALNPDGTTKWMHPTGLENTNTEIAIDDEGNIYFIADRYLIALNSDGTFKWNAYTSGSLLYNCPSIGDDGTIYVATFSSSYYAFNPDGTIKWTAPLTASSSPAVATDGTTYFPAKGKFYAYDAHGISIWSIMTDNIYCNTPLLTADGTIYICTSHTDSITTYTNIVAYKDGTISWKYSIPDGPCSSSPALAADGTLYFANDNYLYAIK